MDLKNQLPTRAGARPYYSRPTEGITGVTLHYTASSPWTTVQAVAAYQTGPNSHLDFPAIAYHLVVDRTGTVYLCHDLDVRVWHNGAVVDGVARNASHVGICYIGNDTPNLAQRRGMQQAIGWCQERLNRKLDVEGHKDSDDTSCPGPTWPEWKGDVIP